MSGVERDSEAAAAEMAPPPKVSRGRQRLRDYIELGKPGIVRFCALMTAGGIGLAPGEVSWQVWLYALVGSSLAVVASNALNMVWERHSDQLMTRTRKRPTAVGRVSAREGIIFSTIAGVVGLLMLGFGVNWLSAGLGLFALVSYVFIYTPLKRVTPLSLVIGAVPGAMPPLLGWAAGSGQIDIGGLLLFAILLIWQMPHFLAICLYRKEEYDRAGIRIVPVVRGDRVAKIQAVLWAALLLPVSLALTIMGITGTVYLVIATVLGVGFLGWSATGLRSGADAIWARRFFFASLIYLPALILALVADAGFSP